MVRHPLTPFDMFEELATGRLKPEWLTDPGLPLQYLLETDINSINRCMEQNYSGYEEIMEPFYHILKRERTSSERTGVNIHELHFPKSSETPAAFPERFVKPLPVQASGCPDDTVSNMYQFVIKGETCRLLQFIRTLIARTTGGSVAKQHNTDTFKASETGYEIRTALEHLNYLIDLATALVRNDTPSETKTCAHYIHTLLRRELMAVKADILASGIIPGETTFPPEKGPPPGMYKTDLWYKAQIRDILDGWIPKYNPVKTIKKMIRLYKEAEAEPANTGVLSEKLTFLKRRKKHIQIIIFLITIRHVHTETVKKKVCTFKNAKKKLKTIENIILYGGNNPEDSQKIFQWHEYLEEAGYDTEMSRLPFVAEQTERIMFILSRAFETNASGPPDSENSSAPSPAVLTAIQRMQKDFMTIKELADYFGVEDGSIRRNLTNLEIPKIKFGGQTFVSYDVFKEKCNL